MKEYNGKSISVAFMPTTVMCGFTPVNGDGLWIADENGKYSIGGENMIFVQNLADQQNIDRFVQGIKYVDQLANPKNREICWGILNAMAEAGNKGSDRYCQLIAFFCDLGLWKEPKKCQKEVWHKDFPKYLANNMYNYYITD